MRFFIDEQLWQLGLVSVTAGFEEFAARNLPSGWHVFKWSYDKDYSLSKGADRAWLSVCIHYYVCV